MANERSERQLKQEIARLQVEIQSLRQRLDRADADLIHSRRENIRLTEQVASLEKEVISKKEYSISIFLHNLKAKPAHYFVTYRSYGKFPIVSGLCK